MFRIFHNSRGSSAHAGYLTSHWCRVFIALVLTLTIGSVGQTAPAQAAPAGELVTYYMEVDNPETTICAGNTVEYRVKVFFENPLLPDPRSNRSSEFAIAGVMVEAFSSDKSVGDFEEPDEVITGFANLDMVTAEFSFTAKKRGTTNLYFEGLVDKKDKSSYVSLMVPVTVIRCKFIAKTVLQVDTEPFDLTGITDDAVMTADDPGTFTGSTSMHWVFSNYNLAPCTLSISPTESQVDLTGQLDEDGGQFVATETIKSTTTSTIAVCPEVGAIGGQAPMNVDGYTLTFKVASSGGVSTQTVGSASARIVVVPEEDKAAAFIPSDHELRVGPPSLRWAMPWDELSSLFGALPALH